MEVDIFRGDALRFFLSFFLVLVFRLVILKLDSLFGLLHFLLGFGRLIDLHLFRGHAGPYAGDGFVSAFFDFFLLLGLLIL